MSLMDHEASGPAVFAGVPLDRFRHVCAFVSNGEGEQQIIDTFACEGLAHGEKLSYIVDPANSQAVVQHFEHLGLDMSRLREAGLFALRTWPETHLHGGQFDPEQMLALAEEDMRASPERRIRMVSDMGWAVAYQSNDLIAYEARANDVVSGFDHIVICVYDIAKFGGDVVVDVLRTHPMVLIGGVLHENPFFVPPALMLDELRRGGWQDWA